VTDMTTEMQGDAMRVLVATDGSDAADTAIELAANIIWPEGTEILVAEAVETGPALFGGPWPAVALVQMDALEEQLRADAGRIVHDAVGRLARPGLKVEGAVLHGRPATAIVNRARSMPADLVIIGSRGHGTIESMVLGSVSAEVVDHSPAPVLVARGSRIDRVLLAWDGSSCASGAADLVLNWPLFVDSKGRVVSVADVDIPWWTGFPEAGSPELMPIYVEAVEASRQQHDQLALEMAARLHAVGLEAEPERRDGDAAAEIIAAARNWKADLIVMGTHGRTGLARLVLGSVARNVIQHAPCSVLVVHDRVLAAGSTVRGAAGG
jgi:nucleotide-binding universal stress UspA family protein